jgi:hypothetical protein
MTAYNLKPGKLLSGYHLNVYVSNTSFKLIKNIFITNEELINEKILKQCN